MLKKTHFIIGIFIALYFLPYVNYKVVFFPVVLLASLIPDLDSFISSRNKYNTIKTIKSKISKDFMHSYTLCVLISILLAFFYPILAFPFFLGYSFHLFLDSLTVEGISPFWPLKARTKGFITFGGKTEKTIDVVFGIFILLLILRYLFFF
ncbi:MAG: metal-dependent hydrolase [Candidatus Pacearchaeota archaeon]